MQQRGSAQVANKSTLNLILGVFLKLLGFFVVMYTYTDTNPLKARQAEESLRQQFNISVSLLRDESKGDNALIANQAMQKEGRSYIAIQEEMKTQLDFLSTNYLAESNVLVLSVPAEYVLSLNGIPAKSVNFIPILISTLQKQRNDQTDYALEIVANGNDQAQLTRAVSILVQKLIAVDYSPALLTIGYNESDDSPTVDFRIKQIKKGA